MSKLLTVVSLMFLVGCSTIRSAGDLEPLNRTDLQSARELISTYDKVQNISGNYHSSTDVNRINRAYGHGTRFSPTSVPQAMQQLQDLERYID